MGNDNIANQTNHLAIDEISIANLVNTRLNRSTKCIKFQYANSKSLDKDTKRSLANNAMSSLLAMKIILR